MGTFSIWHLISLILYIAIFVIPCWRIVSKAGYTGAWALLTLIPFVNLVALRVFAFANWPNGKAAS